MLYFAHSCFAKTSYAFVCMEHFFFFVEWHLVWSFKFPFLSLFCHFDIGESVNLAFGQMVGEFEKRKNI